MEAFLFEFAEYKFLWRKKSFMLSDLFLLGVVLRLVKGRQIMSNGVTRMLKKLCTSKGTTGSSNVSLQLRPFSKWELLSKERICSQREQILSFLSSSL